MRQKKNPSQSTHTRLESANKYTVFNARLGKQNIQIKFYQLNTWLGKHGNMQNEKLAYIPIKQYK